MVRTCVVLGLLIVVSGSAPAEETEGSIVTEASLRPTPEAAKLSALLTPGTPVDIVEREGEWVLVRIEGWVRSTAVETAALPEPAASIPEVAAAATPAAAPLEQAAAEIEGMIRVKLKRLKKLSAAGTEVWLLPAGVDMAALNTGSESDERLAELEAEAARLKSEADTALQTIDQFSEATFRRDDLMSQRKRVLAERADLLAVRHGRHEQMARDAAVARSLADSRGWFGFPSIAPGTYALYARLTKKGMDLEWFEPVTIAGSDVQVELDETSVRGLLPDQQGKR